MTHYGLVSLLPPLLAIFFAIRTKQVFIALLVGIWAGCIIADKGNLFTASLATIQALVDVFKDEGNTRVVIFSALVGAFLAFVQKSGGVQGFIILITRLLNRFENNRSNSSKVIVQLLLFIVSLFIFVESNISILITGTVFRPVFDNLKISREKLAYLVDSTAAPKCMAIPLNGWGAYVMGLLALQGFKSPFAALVSIYPYNLYPLFTLLWVMAIIIWGKDFGPMKFAEKKVEETAKFLPNNAASTAGDEESTSIKAGVLPKAINLILPLVIMIVTLISMLMYTGGGLDMGGNEQLSVEKLIQAIGKGSGSMSVLSAVCFSLLFCVIFYRFQKIMSVGEMIDLSIKGISNLVPLALLMILAFAIGDTCKILGTGYYLAETSKAFLSPAFVPAILFLAACLISFATGTSFGTFAIMLPIAVPIAQTLEVNVYLAIGASISGGVFGDHCSPISDTTILSSFASDTDHISHVKTQMPYAILVGVFTLLTYILIGFLSN